MSDEIKAIRLWALSVEWWGNRHRNRLGAKLMLHVFWRSEQLFAIRFGRNHRPLFSERNRHLPSIQNRWHYLFGKRVTIITPRKEKR